MRFILWVEIIVRINIQYPDNAPRSPISQACMHDWSVVNIDPRGAAKNNTNQISNILSTTKKKPHPAS
jgi:hypothetical protein